MRSKEAILKKGRDYVGVGVCFFCHDGKGNVVMSLRGKNCKDENHRWDIGGGGVDVGEKLTDAVRREIKEEYNATTRKIEYIGFREVHRIQDGKKTHWIAFDFKVLVNPKTIRNSEPHKFDEVRWFALDTLPRNLHSQLHGFMKKYRTTLT